MVAKEENRSRKIIEFDDGRLWFQKKSGSIVLGLTEQGVEELDGIESVSLPNDGDDFDKEDVVVEIEGAEGTISLFTPAAGFVTEVNTAVEDDTALLQEDPLGEGWLVRIEIQDETDLKEFE